MCDDTVIYPINIFQMALVTQTTVTKYHAKEICHMFLEQCTRRWDITPNLLEFHELSIYHHISQLKQTLKKTTNVSGS